VVGALVLIGPLMALIAIPLLGSIIVVSRYIRRRLAGVDPWPKETIAADSPATAETAPPVRER
jgi:hypothetical protein